MATKFTPKNKKITGTKKNDTIKWVRKEGWKSALTVNAGNGNDKIDFRNSVYKNKLNGQNGKDTIYGGKKNDTITGGKSNDTIYTGKGTNTVIIHKGDGNDTITNQGTTIIKMADYNKKDKVTFSKTGQDLKITYAHVKTSKDKKQVKEIITVKNYFTKAGTVAKNTLYIINAEGNTKKQNISSLLNSRGLTMSAQFETTLQGTPYKDTITGSYGNDKIYGGKNNDIINGNGGNDLIDGGDGNDNIYGGGGNDNITGGNGDDSIAPEGGTNIVNAGNGDDTINISDGINTINAGNDNDKIYVKGGKNVIDAGAGTNEIHFDSSGYFTAFENTVKKGGGVDTLFFDDQSGWTNVATEYDGDNLKVYAGNSNTIVLEDYKNGHSVQYVSINGESKAISDLPVQFTGTDGDEIIYGDSIANVITSKKGNDTIYGSSGNDTIVFNNGDGNDEVHQGVNGDTDSLKFADSELSDLDFSRGLTDSVENDDLIISYNGGTDSVTVKDYFTAGNTVTQWIDKNEESYDLATVNRHVINSNEDTVNGTIFNDEITVNSSNSTIYGKDGANTYLISENGTYNIISKSGRDTISFSDIELDDLVFAVSNDNVTIKNADETLNITVSDYLLSIPALYVKGTTGNPVLLTSKLADLEFICSDAELIEGRAGVADRIFGGDSANLINGLGGGDTINGGKGNDTIIFWNDSEYIGHSTVINGTEAEAGEVDTLNFNCVLDLLDYEVIGNDLKILYTKYPDNSFNSSVIIKDYYTNGNTFKNLKLPGGYNGSISDIKHVISGPATVKYDTALNDRIKGTTAGDDTLYSINGGDDEFIGYNGADTYVLKWYNNDYEHRQHVSISMEDYDEAADIIKFIDFDDSSGLGNGNTLLIRDNNDLTIWYNMSEADTSLPWEGSAYGVIGEYNGEEVGRKAQYRFYSSVRIKNYFAEYDDYGYVLYPNPIDKVIFEKNNTDTVEDSILAHYVNDMGSFENEETPIMGTKYRDEISVTSCTVNAGDGNDIISAWNYDNNGQNSNKTKLYGGAGNDKINLKNNELGPRYKLDTSFISGGTGNDEISISGAEDNDHITLEFSNGDGQDTIGNSEYSSELVNLIFKFTDIAAKNLSLNKNSNDAVLSYGTGSDNVTILKYYTKKYNNFTAVDSNNNHNYFKWAEKSSEIQTAGNDDVLTVTDEASTGLHIVFDIAKNGTAVTEDSLWVLNDTNYANWQTKMADSTSAVTYTGINIKGSDITAIETIRANDGKYLTTTQLNALQSAVAGWLSDGRDYADVSAALASDDKEALITFIAAQTNWQTT